MFLVPVPVALVRIIPVSSTEYHSTEERGTEEQNEEQKNIYASCPLPFKILRNSRTALEARRVPHPSVFATLRTLTSSQGIT